MNDPVQMLIDAGAIPQSPFAPLSRYAGVEIVNYQPPRDAPHGDAGIPYVRRRFIPRGADIPVVHHHTVHAGDRIDALAFQYLGDAELHWRIADANLADDWLELTFVPGKIVAIPTPPAAIGRDSMRS